MQIVIPIRAFGKLLPASIKTQIFAAQIPRQCQSDVSCYGIAIHDCMVFQNNPKIIEESIELNQPVSHQRENSVVSMKKLHPSLIISDPVRLLALRMQLVILGAHGLA